MSSQADELVRFLRVMDEAGCLEHVVLIGSWAEYVWWHAGLLEGFRPNIRTLDIDLLVRNMHRPVPEVHLTAVAREHGYPVESDRLTGVTKIYSLGGLEIEFLIGKVGAGRESSLNTNLGVVAQSLRHLDVLARFTIEVDLEGLRLRVPTPEAYAVHKMAVNHERGRKKEKDAKAIERMWPHLDRGCLATVLESCTRRERSRVDAFMAQHGLEG